MSESRTPHIRVADKLGDPHTAPPITLRQGPTLRQISEISKNFETSKRFYEGLEWVREDDLDYVDLLLAFGAIKTAGEMDHLRRHWYPKSYKEPSKEHGGEHHKHNSAWWQGLQPITQ